MNINDYKDVNGNVEVSENLVSDLIGDLNTHKAEIATQLELGHVKVPATPSSTPITLLNGWINVNQLFGVYKDDFGRCFLDGYITGGTIAAGTEVFRLSEGYRPSVSDVVLTASNQASGTFVALRLTSEGVATMVSTNATPYLRIHANFRI